MKLEIRNKENLIPSRDELAAWLHFTRLPGIGPVKGAFFLQQYSIPYLLNASVEQLKSLGWKEPQLQHWLRFCASDYESVLEWAEKPQHYILTQEDSAYPELLRQTVGAPLVLFVQGSLECLAQQQIAIVGSRTPSKEGIFAAETLAKELVRHQLTVTSGLARGIDAISHHAAVAAGGQTIAVQGCGLNHVYPSKHKQLAQQIMGLGGALLSEFFPNVAPKAEHFPRRNRIISGMSLGCVVIDAAEKSGSLITARYAAEQNREVFAVPNLFGSAQQGCNRLIQQGAKLVCHIDDILDEILPQHGLNDENRIPIPYIETTITNSQLERDVSHLPFYKLLDNVRREEPLSIDVLAEISGLAVQEVMTAFITFELEGLVTSVPGGYVKAGEMNHV